MKIESNQLKTTAHADVTVFCTCGSERNFTLQKRWYADEEENWTRSKGCYGKLKCRRLNKPIPESVLFYRAAARLNAGARVPEIACGRGSLAARPQAAGGTPTSRLKARPKAASDS
jgi:hypothetical protein